MEFKDMQTTKKGDYGECLVDEYYIHNGYTPYAPTIEGAHTIDRMYCKKSTTDIFIADIKAKPFRNSYPDTGLNTKHYNEYISASLKLGVEVRLIFVDEKMGRMYGNTLTNLMKYAEFGIHSYPWEHGKQTYFLLSSMKKMRDLTLDEIEKLRSFK